MKEKVIFIEYVMNVEKKIVEIDKAIMNKTSPY